MGQARQSGPDFGFGVGHFSGTRLPNLLSCSRSTAATKPPEQSVPFRTRSCCETMLQQTTVVWQQHNRGANFPPPLWELDPLKPWRPFSRNSEAHSGGSVSYGCVGCRLVRRGGASSSLTCREGKALYHFLHEGKALNYDFAGKGFRLKTCGIEVYYTECP